MCEINMINYSLRTFNEQPAYTDFSSYVLGADVGGTNTNISIAGIKNSKPTLLFSLDFKSKELESLTPAVEEILKHAYEKHNIEVNSACFGVAGAVSADEDLINLTNVEWDISKKELSKKTSLENILFLNDFQTVGYGINLLNPKNTNDMFEIRAGKSYEHISRQTKSILGAGTGLGKSILIYDKDFDIYVPFPSEGGHGDFPVQNNFEMKLLEFIKDLRNISYPVTYEELLSGRAIESIYLFLRKTQKYDVTNYTEEIDKSEDKTNLISKHRESDETCRETFRLFAIFYARCAKNFVLDTMATGGLYIAGGIASKNREIFRSKEFLDEFENAYRRSHILKEVPIYIILNYDVSLYGACLAALHHSKQ